jgi:hypothetical protein
MLSVKHEENAMPKGPNGEKRPADAVGLAVLIAKIATGEVEESRRYINKDDVRSDPDRQSKPRLSPKKPS